MKLLSRRGTTLSLALVVLLGLPRVASAGEAKAPASPATSASQRQARGDAAARAFIMGKYDEALTIYSELYIASDGRPEYLRNIGRCQQKLKQHDAAIDTFRDYLRRMKRMSNEERREVQGFISESETARLNQSNAAQGGGSPPAVSPPPTAVAPSPPPAAAPPPPAATPSPAAATPPPAAVEQPPAVAPATPPAASTAAPVTPLQPQQPAASPPGYYVPPAGYPAQSQPAAGYPTQSPPPYNYAPTGYDASRPPAGGLSTSVPAAPPPRRHTSAVKVLGVVGIIAGAVVLAGGVGAWALSQSTYDSAKSDGCPNGSSNCQTKADVVKTMNSASKVLGITGGVLAALGVTLVIVAPSSTSKPTQVGFVLQQRF